MQRFQAKVVIVTGAASGIGEATARRFSSEGASVALVDRNEIPLAKVASDLPGPQPLAHVADVLPHLEKTKGSIINTASVSGLGGDWGMSPYNAAKGAVVNLTRSLALDLGKKGVRINSVCPSLTRTGMTADMMDDKELIAKFAERIPLGRVCEPHEVAAVIAFLASDDASFMTGANVTVDGGVSASNGQPPQG